MQITEYAHDGVLVLAVSGRLNFYSRKVFQAVMKNAERTIANHVVVNLEAVEYLDSVALGLLVLSQANLSLKGIEMSLVGPRGPVKEILDMANIPKLIPVYSSEEEAINLPVAV
ncbi:MAG: STAS domain-containing protein [Nitrospinae bacterium]|nr:STAS domain-containing protein [Nitrospinota bacterium]